MLLGTIWRGAALAVAGEFQLSFPLSPALSLPLSQKLSWKRRLVAALLYRRRRCV